MLTRAFFSRLQNYSALRQVLRYGVGGLAINGFLYLLYLLCTYKGLESKLAMSLTYALGCCLGFIVHRYWTFGSSSAVTRSVAGYLFAQLSGFGLNWIMLLLLSDWLGYPHQIIQAMAIFVVAGYLFIIYRYVVFTNVKSEHC